MQQLRDEGKLVKKRIKLSNAFAREGLTQSILFVSHRWEETGEPDGLGTQLRTMKEHLRQHPTIQYVWYDFCCMPQRGSADADGRTPTEAEEFRHMLSAIADLYLTCHVLILLDGSYKSRFWTLMEAWCAMMTATAAGVRTACEAERRYTIQCIHSAGEHDEQALIKLVSTKTPDEMHDILALPDIYVTNAKDKHAMLPVVKKTNKHVMQKFLEGNIKSPCAVELAGSMTSSAQSGPRPTRACSLL